MKHKAFSWITKMGGMFAALAFVVTQMTANTACFWLSYQPEEPAEVKQLKKH